MKWYENVKEKIAQKRKKNIVILLWPINFFFTVKWSFNEKEIIAQYVYNNNYSFSILSWKRFVHFLLLEVQKSFYT